jgi:hypothetical protein
MAIMPSTTTAIVATVLPNVPVTKLRILVATLSILPKAVPPPVVAAAIDGSIATRHSSAHVSTNLVTRLYSCACSMALIALDRYVLEDSIFLALHTIFIFISFLVLINFLHLPITNRTTAFTKTNLLFTDLLSVYFLSINHNIALCPAFAINRK